MTWFRSARINQTPGLLSYPARSGFVVLIMILSLAPMPAAAQDVQALLDRIERLERDIRTLNTQISRGDGAVVATGQDSNLSGSNTPSGAGIARIDARITALENDVRAATGAMEGLDHRIFELSTTLEKLIGDVEFRLTEMERKLGGVPIAGNSMQSGTVGMVDSSSPQVSTVAPAGNVTQVMTQQSEGVLGTITETELQQISSVDTAVTNTTIPNTQTVGGTSLTDSEASVSVAATVAPVSADPALQLSPQDQYTQAFGLLRQAKYDDAAIALQVFVNQNPDDPLADNARYWLGETFYVRSEFIRAAEVFFEGYRISPSGPKAPDTLLKLGMSLGKLGKQAEACAAFTKLGGEFPDASTNVRNTMERERIRNGC